MMESLEMRPGRRHAIAAGATETAGGTMLALGALTPLPAAALIGTMITAIRKVHLENGFFASNGGYEFNLTLIAGLVAIIDGGPGPVSVDRALGIECTGGRWALATFAAGAAGSAIAVAAGEHVAHQEAGPSRGGNQAASVSAERGDGDREKRSVPSSTAP
jgi:putative oxidoreductase